MAAFTRIDFIGGGCRLLYHHGRHYLHHWQAIADAIAEETGCDPDDLGVEEIEDGRGSYDETVVHRDSGKHIARITSGRDNW